MPAQNFCEAVFVRVPSGFPVTGWQDYSDGEYFNFRTTFGWLRLRRRNTYPATFSYVVGSKLYAGYGDVQIGYALASTPARTHTEEHFYGSEFLFIVADAQTQSVTVQRDALSTLPLFYGTQPGLLAVSDRFERICKLVGPRWLQVDPVTVVSVLRALPTHGRTLCSNVSLLYDRMRLTWRAGAHTLARPPDARISQQHILDGNVQEWRMRLEATLYRYAQHFGRASLASDLSGGKDSAIVAGFLRLQGQDPITLTMQLQGNPGMRQAEKIEAMRQHFGLRSLGVALDDEVHYPFDFLVREGERPFYHYWGGASFGARDALLQEAARHGVATVFTGYGGDELCEHVGDRKEYVNKNFLAVDVSPNDLPEQFRGPHFEGYLHYASDVAGQREPNHVPLVSPSIATIMACDTYSYFENNIWPASPLSHPALYAYCQSLPLRYRYNRNLHRVYLMARRYPALIYNDTDEHMGDHHTTSFFKNTGALLQYYFGSSVLGAHGIVHIPALMQAYSTARSNPGSTYASKVASMFMRLLQIEINLQALRLRTL